MSPLIFCHNGWRLAQCDLLTKNLNINEMTKAEEIYHRFVQYEWNEIGEGMKKSILDAINEALRQPPVSGSLQDRLFELANDFAVAKKGEVAVKLHSIHNGLQ
jgi:hypothetical protein